MSIDLHMHSTSSDGALNPAELMAFAREKGGVETVALTDHDTVQGVAEARHAAEALGMRFIPGIEISSLWGSKCIHVVGLNVDPASKKMLYRLKHLSDCRVQRAAEIGEKLSALGFPGLHEAALKLSRNKLNVSRMHFAQAMVQAKIVRHIQEAFDKYLGEGQRAYIPTLWLDIATAVEVIHEAGGVAVLAHPGRYKFPELWQLEALVKDFRQMGGEAIEVVSGSQSAEYIQICCDWARRYDFYASTGSDFHSEIGKRPLPGCQGALPSGVKSVLRLL